MKILTRNKQWASAFLSVYIFCGSQLRSHTTANEIFTAATIGRHLEVRERFLKGSGESRFCSSEDQRSGQPENRRRSSWRRPLGRDHRSDLTRFKPSHMLVVFVSLSCLHLFHFKLH
ncbi:uncharacterized protein LOC117139828 [Drosophila mauritiana]|uniref:Uncharacterized protein LOC117139828 n=1 Tax=Drosophila mauritiana TaxID=7226 RepID=A0A6P8JQE5_DROMA|nr:uncharacterized protein LOC117139828 [Drosophila mauritiana]